MEESALLLQDIFVLDYVDVSKHTYIQNCKVVEIMKTESLKNGNSFKLIDYQTHRKKGYSLLSL